MALLLRGLQTNLKPVRAAFFSNLLSSRRRERVQWKGTSLKEVFALSDPYELTAFRAKVANFVNAIKSRGIQSTSDAFAKFDSMSDSKINATELANAIVWLGLPFDTDDVVELLEGADKDDDGLIDLSEFAALVETSHEPFAVEADEKSDLLPKLVRTVSLTRLPISSEFRAQYALDEAARVARIAAREAAEENTRRAADEVKERELKQMTEARERARAREAEIVARKQSQTIEYKIWICTWDNMRNEDHIVNCTGCSKPRSEVERKWVVSPAEDYIGHDPYWTCSMYFLLFSFAWIPSSSI